MSSDKNTIRFLFNDEIREVDLAQRGLKPSTTVLNYLRSLPGFKGVKEGCAEGDCGACTVVVAELNERNELVYKAVNSCLVFLPMIHGKQLITVEHLIQKENGKEVLHPVQQAMIDCYGSQCGYCTPGFIMSMFAIYKNHRMPTRKEVAKALAGNLCRCTGYRPIIDAAIHACNAPGQDQFKQRALETEKTLRELKQNQASLKISTGNQLYLKAFTLEQALEFRTAHPSAMIVAGATDAALLQTKKRIHIPEILDISAVDELNLIVEDHHKVVIGATTPVQEILEFAESRLPSLVSILDVFGSLQIRNIATLGGNIGSASPIGDALPVLIAMDTTIKLLSKNGQREISLEDFITGYRQTALKKDEIIGLIIINKPEKNTLVKSYKISKRRELDIATVSAGFALQLNENHIVTQIKLAFGGMAAMPLRASEAEGFLTGKTWKRENVEKAANMVSGAFQPISDARAEAESRRIMAANLLIKFWEDTTKISLKTA